MKKQILQSPDSLIPLVRAHIETVASTKQEDEVIRIGLPGGRSVKPLIQGMLSLEHSLFTRIRLYLLDERLTGERNEETLLRAGLDEAITSKRFLSTSLVIPEVGAPLLEGDNTPFDLIYLGVGEDGHIASLFPGSYPSEEKEQTALVTNSPKPPLRRVTFTYSGFTHHAGRTPIYLLFFGEGKRDALNRLLSNKEGADTLPCAFFVQEGFPLEIITDIQE